MLQKHSLEHVSASGAEEALGGHHTRALGCSLSQQPVTSTLSCHRLFWKLTMMMAARAHSPSEGRGSGQHAEEEPQAQKKGTNRSRFHEQWAHVYRNICSHQSESSDPNQHPQKLAGDGKTRRRLCPRTLGPQGGRKGLGACSQEGGLDSDVVNRDASEGGCGGGTHTPGQGRSQFPS